MQEHGQVPTETKPKEIIARYRDSIQGLDPTEPLTYGVSSFVEVDTERSRWSQAAKLEQAQIKVHAAYDPESSSITISIQRLPVADQVFSPSPVDLTPNVNTLVTASAAAQEQTQNVPFSPGPEDTTVLQPNEQPAIEQKEELILDLQTALEAHLQRGPDGPTFPQATINYMQTGLNLSVHKFSQVLRKQFPLEGTAIAHMLHAILNDSIALPPTDLSRDASDKVVLRSPTGSRVFANRVVESVYHANPNLGRWGYAICLYPARNPRYAYSHYPGFNMRLTNILDSGDLPMNSPEAKIIAVGYITQIAKLQGVSATRELIKRAVPYGGIAGLEFIKQQKESLITRVMDIKRHQAAIAESLSTIDSIAQLAGFDEPEVQLLLDLAFLKGRAFDSQEEFQKLLRPIVRFISVGDWEQAFAHRDFLLDYFIGSFPKWRQREYQAYMEQPSYESMSDVVRSVKKGQLNLGQDDVPEAYRPLFGETLQRKVARAELRDYRGIIYESLQLSNAILSGIGESRGNFVDLPSPSGGSAREMSRVQILDNKQVCVIYGAKSRRFVNFGAILYTRIYHGLKYDERHHNSSDAKDILKAIEGEYNQQRRIYPNLKYSLKDYLIALFHSGKGRLSESDPVVHFLQAQEAI